MKLKLLLIYFFFFASALPVLAHVCDDVLQHDPIVIWPEKQTLEITETGQFKIFLRNDYSESIHDVRLIAPSSLFKFSINPPLIERVRPKEEVSFLVNLSISEEIKSGSYPISIKIKAQEFTIDREVNLTIEVKKPFRPPPQLEPKPEPEPQPKPQAIIEIAPKDILVAMSVFPDILEVKPKERAKFKIFIRNGHSQSLHHLIISIPQERFEILNINPEIIREIKPGTVASFEVALAVPAQIKEGNYPLFTKVKAQEFALAREVSLIIKVKKVKKWLIYLYLLAILSLIGLLIWRWRRITQRQSR